ncbi:MAG: hypothetical protein HY901_05725 [Deltaproteobacteria bacterium]|nr:hypothetical protein [Deltaproteobacteria bacterium]
MRSLFVLVALGAAVVLTGCGHRGGGSFHREMLGKAIAEFSSPMKDQSTERVWVANMDDSTCDAHDVLLGKGSGSSLSFGGGKGGSYDALAYEVFSNYLTQKKKGKVVEAHRHNYSTDLKVATHQQVELLLDDGKKKVNAITPEDLCLLDEAKKRNADKVLAYQVVSMSGQELRIHLRLSDVRSGLVELSRTLLVQRGVVADISF